MQAAQQRVGDRVRLVRELQPRALRGGPQLDEPRDELMALTRERVARFERRPMRVKRGAQRRKLGGRARFASSFERLNARDPLREPIELLSEHQLVIRIELSIDRRDAWHYVVELVAERARRLPQIDLR